MVCAGDSASRKHEHRAACDVHACQSKRIVYHIVCRIAHAQIAYTAELYDLKVVEDFEVWRRIVGPCWVRERLKLDFHEPREGQMGQQPLCTYCDGHDLKIGANPRMAGFAIGD